MIRPDCFELKPKRFSIVEIEAKRAPYGPNPIAAMITVRKKTNQFIEFKHLRKKTSSCQNRANLYLQKFKIKKETISYFFFFPLISFFNMIFLWKCFIEQIFFSHFKRRGRLFKSGFFSVRLHWQETSRTAGNLSSHPVDTGLTDIALTGGW